MSPELPYCSREREIAAAARGGPWTEALRRHLEECEFCAVTVATVSILQSEAEGQTVPPAGLAMWRVRLRERRELEERAALPLVWGERLAALLAAVGTVAFIGMGWEGAGWAAPVGAFLTLGALAAVAVSWISSPKDRKGPL
jgi:hypothetical protein